MTATVTPTEDLVFEALFDYCAKVLALPDTTDAIVKGYQNLVATPLGSYVVVSPGILQRQDFGRWGYDGDGNTTSVSGHHTYSYQLDCYGPLGAEWAVMLATAWRSMWGATAMRGRALTPLHADAPRYMSIINSEGQFENRWMLRLFGQINHVVTLPQDFFDAATLNSIVVADQLP